MKKKNLFLWVVSLLIPVIGIILYFVLKNKDSKSSVIKGSILGICIYSILFLYLATHGIDYFNRSIDEWYDDIKSGNTVVTVLGASYCEHCQAYKPVIQKIASKNKINLYFYEVDLLSEEDEKRLTDSFYIGEYDESVPYTFIMDKGSYVAYHSGYQFESDITSFLWENGLIKN